MKKKNILERFDRMFFADYLIIFVGCILYALSVVLFTSPNNIAPGGVIGISTMINYAFPFFLLVGVLEELVFCVKQKIASSHTAPRCPPYRKLRNKLKKVGDTWNEDQKRECLVHSLLFCAECGENLFFCESKKFASSHTAPRCPQRPI